MASLPKTVEAFFDAKNSQDYILISNLFSDKAVVIDGGENKTITGEVEISEWIKKSLTTLNLSSEIIDANQVNGIAEVEAKVSDDFPGSPVKFLYKFTLKDEKITTLDIEYLGQV